MSSAPPAHAARAAGVPRQNGPDGPDVAPAALLAALRRAAAAPAKPLVRATDFDVFAAADADAAPLRLTSWRVAEFAYRKAQRIGVAVHDELPTLARGLFTAGGAGAVEGVADGAAERAADGAAESAAEVAAESTAGAADGAADGAAERTAESTLDSTADASGGPARIVVRGYDKFFNVGELPWTRPEAIAAHSAPPYVATFKENGCIIFIAAPDARSLVVCSKHSLGARPDTERSHAQVGEAWLQRHLAAAGRTREQLAAELHARNMTAVAELCDDSFEEHVLAYSAARSGLHLHGLNSNSVAFRTAPIEHVADFAAAWGFLPPRWRSFADLRALQAFTDAVGETGSWEGEAIEGFVVRTHMPAADADAAPAASSSTARPPYGPGQDWFFKVKYEEPYLMYRDWRELTRTTLAEHKAWKEQVHAARERQQTRAAAQQAAAEARGTQPQAAAAEPSAASVSSEPEASSRQAASADAPPAGKLSKNAAKRLAKAAHKADGAARKAAGEAVAPAAGSSALPPPPPPVKPRSSRPETKVYVRWVHERVHGSPDGRIKPEPALFAHFDSGRGIIALRERYLEWLQTEEGRHELLAVGGTVAERPRSDPFTHTLIVPVGVPGCGKTVLSLALAQLFPGVLHQQADDVTGKKAGPAFIRAIGKALGSSANVIADRNNHCFRHRTELVDEARKFETRALQIAAARSKSKPDTKQAAPASAPRVRLVALAYALETVPLNALHRVCSQRILARGQNHQSLRADAKGASGTKEHEVILWRFLEEVQPFGTGGKGEGTEGAADERFDEVVRLDVQASEEVNLAQAVDALVPLLGCERPRDEELAAALAHAHAYKAPVTRKGKDAAAAAEGEAEGAAAAVKGARYYGLTVEIDPFAALAPILRAHAADSPRHAEARDFLQRLSRDGRINKSPHVTLVHHVELAKPSEEAPEAPLQPTPEQQHAQAKWERYAALCAPGAAEVQFAIHLDRIAWDRRVMTFGVGRVESDELPGFEALQRGAARGDGSGAWTPHVTIGTTSDEVRPFEANRVLRDADAGAGDSDGAVQLLRLENAELVATGWLRGMFR